ncbi:S-(hydroxymethyl)glutathione dehydrogenase (Glutathione-dependent formaldehyde dehydrogenase) (FALDH) (FDH) [Durusdinium trenchii]|uniref:S-(Hydroxymethyl)glutathione dehydrogenase (Glutathione-dependent formaldehyde dehydrogenase) (FALDH) (FDH) n=1 Tax=Durusdinium trenchii TaxID=1381693 RepID=A0ABP0J2B0_9DINO
MKAAVFHDVGDVRLDDVPEPKLQESTDAIIRITSSAICGTDLHMIRGTMPGMKPGTILGHEAVGVVEELGDRVRYVTLRLVAGAAIRTGSAGDRRRDDDTVPHGQIANPNGSLAGTAFFGGPKASGPFDGLQAEYARIPYAHVGLVKLPEDVTDEQAILISDIFPTGYFGARLAEIKSGDTVAVFGCGPVGMFAILSAHLLGASRVIAVDRVPSRLKKAKQHQAEVINFEEEDPVEAIRELTGGIGVDRAIDAVGVDAVAPQSGPASPKGQQQREQFQREQNQIAPKTSPQGDQWVPGDAPSQVLRWAVDALAKAGTLSIIGVYPPQDQTFPIGEAMNKNLSILMGNCNHRKYIPELLRLVQSGRVTVDDVVSQVEPLTAVLDAYKQFDQRESGWMKVKLEPSVA